MKIICSLILCFASVAHADIYKTCLGGEGEVKNSLKIEVDILPNQSVVYTRSSYIGSSDCVGVAKSVDRQWQFKFLLDFPPQNFIGVPSCIASPTSTASRRSTALSTHVLL